MTPRTGLTAPDATPAAVGSPQPGARPEHASRPADPHPADAVPRLAAAGPHPAATARQPADTVPSRPAHVRARVPFTLRRAGNRTAELVTFHAPPDEGEHIAVLFPTPDSGEPEREPTDAHAPLVRLHSECLTGDLFGSARCDCGPQLDEALALLARHGGALLYLRQEGRGIGLYSKLDAYVLQDAGADTFEANRLLGRGADERDYRTAALMLHALGLRRVTLLTNNPDKERQLRAHGIEVTATRPTGVHVTPDNTAYLEAKARGGHRLLPFGRPGTEEPV
ncbi:GTP cyclohydrolase II RibA [Streptomyces cellulosae]|uniref:GTP cyclohydrolase II n=1 Tax=Streptomyces sp. McG8 TaxID=2725487 RepID=UPI001BE964FF